MRRISSTLTLVLALALLAACGGGGAAKEAEQAAVQAPSTSGGTSKETASDLEEVAEDIESAEDADTGASEEKRSISDIIGNLAKLDSYELSYAFVFEGTDDDGNPVSSRIEYSQSVIREPFASYTKTFMSDNDADSKDMLVEFFYLDGKTYLFSENDGEAGCIYSGDPDNDGSNMLFNPSSLVNGLESAKLVARGEMVNGIKTDRYKVEEVSGGLLISGELSAEAWIAQDSDLVVKYVGTATGKGGWISSSSKEGKVTWDYELSSVDSLSAIELPAACQETGAASDIPVPNNLLSDSSFGGMTVYTTSDALADVAKLYEEGLPANGWSVEKVDMGVEIDTLVQLKATKDDREISVMITYDEEESKTTVMISE